MSHLIQEQNRSKARSRARQSKERQEDSLIPLSDTKSRKSNPRMKIRTEEERKRRHGEEICAKHGGNIVAFARDGGRMLWEKGIYFERHDKAVFAATCAKSLHSKLKNQHEDFIELSRKWLEIDPQKARKNIERKISKFFDIYRNKINELESQVVEKVVNSSNLEKLLENTRIPGDEHQESSYTRKGDFEMKFDEFRDEFEEKINAARFTYICLNQEHFAKGIKEIEDDNKMLDKKIKAAQKLIESIFDSSENEERIHNIFSKLTSDLLLIDERNPLFNEFTENPKVKLENNEGSEEDYLISNRFREQTKTQNAPTQTVFHSEEMNSYYYMVDNTLNVKELDEDSYQEQKILDSKYYLQKVITVPTETVNRVFLFGGAKDVDGNDVVDETFEVDLETKALNRCHKMNQPKVSMAAGLSPD